MKNNIIQEDYVSFEVAKLLREKGFDGSCYQKYDDEGYLSFNSIGYINSDKLCYDFYALAPTLQMAMKWLREVFNIFIEIGTSIDLNGKYHFSYTILDKECKYVKRGYTDFDWNYEQACEAAIKYVLENLI